MDAIVQDDIPLAERAYRDLKQAIVRCIFQPEERLRVDDLSKRFDLSSSPIREALNRLSEQGFVRALDKRGFRVAPLTVDGIADLTRVRLLVECEALRDSLQHGDDRWEAALVAEAHALALVERRLGQGPVALDDNWSARHRAFHMAIYAGSRSPLLLEMVEGLFDRAERYRRYSAQYRKLGRSKGNEHGKILDVVLSRDIDTAVEYVSRHVVSTRDMVTQALQAKEGGLARAP